MKQGDLIALVAPASPLPAADARAAAVFLESLGYKVLVCPGCMADTGYLAGDDSLRAKDINAAFAASSVRGVYCLRGGYGCQRLLDKLDWDVIRDNPKFFGGYSDVTALHAAFNQLCGMKTYHMPMAAKLAQNPGAVTLYYAAKCFAEDLTGELRAESSLRPGKAAGALAGGNLSVLAASLGTPYEIDAAGKLLFLEDANEEPYKIDRAMNQLRLAGKFDDCVGVVLGQFVNCGPSVAEIADGLLPAGLPCVYDFPCGHALPTLSLPMGGQAILDAGRRTLTLTA